MTYDFAFSLEELPTAAINLLRDFSVWVAVRDLLTDSATADEAVEMLTDYGYLDEDLAWS